VFTLLYPGHYSVTFERAGFQTTVVKNLTLVIDQVATQDESLPLSAVSQQVTVTASGAAVLNTETASVGQVMGAQPVEQLPLNGRNFMQLAQVSAGVTPIDSGQGMQTPASYWTGHANTVLSISGTREDDVSYLFDGIETRNGWWGSVGLRPSVDAIEEFKVQNTGGSAEYGLGFVFVNTTTRAGTNALHGSVYEFVRNNDMDARSFFDIGPKPPYHHNQFGGTIGGALIKNKLFFFGDYEGFRQDEPATSYTVTPTPSEVEGNYSASKTTLIDPTTGAPFPGNQIPAARIDPIGAKIAAYFPAPNGQFGPYNYEKVLSYLWSWNQAMGRIDYSISPKDNVFFRYLWHGGQTSADSFSALSANTNPEPDQNMAAAWTHSFSGTLLNELRLGWNRSRCGLERQGAYDSAYANPFGFPVYPARPAQWGLTRIGFGQGYMGIGSNETDLDRDDNFEARETLSIVHGRHTIKAGLNIRYNPVMINEDWGQPAVVFGGSYTGDDVADLLLGLPNSASDSVGDPIGYMSRIYQAYFVQDDIKVSPHLTVNAGMRYEYNSPEVEAHNHVGTFDGAIGKYLLYPYAGLTISGVNTDLAVVDPNLRRSIYPGNYHNFGPRFGVAWRPFGEKTVIRAGGGIYYGAMDANNQLGKVYIPTLYDIYTFTAGSVPTIALDNLFSPSSSAFSPLFMEQDQRVPTEYAEEWAFSVQRMLTPSIMLDVGYDGSAGHHLTERVNINGPADDPTGLLSIQQRVPWPAFAGAIADSEASGNSNYNALTVRVEKRYNSGVWLLGSYTYSRSLDYPFTDEMNAWPNNKRLSYGASTFNIPQRLVFSGLYELPFGRGKRFLGNAGRVANALAGGWQLSEIATFELGPGDDASTAAPKVEGSFMAVFPDRIGPVNDSSLRADIRKDNMGPYFRTQDIADTVGNVQGDAPRDFIIVPGLNNWDISLSRTGHIREKTVLQFRADFFNAFNHAQFYAPDTTIDTPGFGYIYGARDGRDIQLSLKLSF
jgi:hypothetical protein